MPSIDIPITYNTTLRSGLASRLKYNKMLALIDLPDLQGKVLTGASINWYSGNGSGPLTVTAHTSNVNISWNESTAYNILDAFSLDGTVDQTVNSYQLNTWDILGDNTWGITQAYALGQYKTTIIFTNNGTTTAPTTTDNLTLELGDDRDGPNMLFVARTELSNTPYLTLTYTGGVNHTIESVINSVFTVNNDLTVEPPNVGAQTPYGVSVEQIDSSGNSYKFLLYRLMAPGFSGASPTNSVWNMWCYSVLDNTKGLTIEAKIDSTVDFSLNSNISDLNTRYNTLKLLDSTTIYDTTNNFYSWNIYGDATSGVLGLYNDYKTSVDNYKPFSFTLILKASSPVTTGTTINDNVILWNSVDISGNLIGLSRLGFDDSTSLNSIRTLKSFYSTNSNVVGKNSVCKIYYTPITGTYIRPSVYRQNTVVKAVQDSTGKYMMFDVQIPALINGDILSARATLYSSTSNTGRTYETKISNNVTWANPINAGQVMDIYDPTRVGSAAINILQNWDNGLPGSYYTDIYGDSQYGLKKLFNDNKIYLSNDYNSFNFNLMFNAKSAPSPIESNIETYITSTSPGSFYLSDSTSSKTWILNSSSPFDQTLSVDIFYRGITGNNIFPPSDVSGITATNINYTSVTINWLPSTDPDIVSVTTNYILEYKPTSAINWISAGNTVYNTMNLYSLTSGTSYDVRITADDGINFSNPTVVNSLFSTLNYGPGPISNLTATNITTSSANLNWTAATDPENNPILYKVYYKKTIDVSYIHYGDTTMTNMNLISLDSATTYDVNIVSSDYNTYIDGSNYIDIALFRTLKLAPSDPILSSDLVKATYTNLSWTASSDIYSSSITYELSYSSLSNQVYTTISDLTDLLYTLHNLIPRTIYQIRLRAYNGEVYSNYSTIFVTTIGSTTSGATAGAFIL